MNRIHLIEFEDQPWFPGFLRNYMTDLLQFLANKSKLFKPSIGILDEMLKSSKENNIIDLGSGGGGGLLYIAEELAKAHPDLNILMTDLYPNISAFKYTKTQNDIFSYKSLSIDARKVPAELKGLRTQFLSLHHFRPEEAKAILQNGIKVHRYGFLTRNPSLIILLSIPVVIIQSGNTAYKGKQSQHPKYVLMPIRTRRII